MTTPSSPVDDRVVLEQVKRLQPQLIAWRRHLHMHPELSHRELETTAYLSAQLRDIGIRLLPLKGMKTGVLAEVVGRSTGPIVALRADIDALPVPEKTGLKYASRNAGCMHACGHDVHSAMVLGAASILHNLRPKLPGRVRLLFQPAEEMPPGGARPMIAHGALKGVKTIIGIHTDPTLPTGQIGLRDGSTMASVYDFDLVIHGRGGHAARPHDAVDPIVTAAEVVESIQKIVSREIDPMSPVAITFGTIAGGAARNVIADEVRLSATARTLSPAVLVQLPKLIKRTVAGICRARGAAGEVIEVASYPVLVNDPATNRLLAAAFERLFGRNRVTEAPQVLGGEDFACYLEKVPGAWLRLGVKNQRLGAVHPWHSPHFRVDESAMSYGTALLVAATLDFLKAHP